MNEKELYEKQYGEKKLISPPTSLSLSLSLKKDI